MSTTRRTVLTGAAAMGAAPATSARPVKARTSLLIDAELAQGPPPSGAVVIPTGVFLDPGVLAASPPGDYEAQLTPANRFLLLEALRHARVAHVEQDDVVLFRRPAAWGVGRRRS